MSMSIGSILIVIQLALWVWVWGKNWRQIFGLHHFWFGIAAQIASGVLHHTHPEMVVVGVLLWVAGYWLSLDDLYQHWRQKRQLKYWESHGHITHLMVLYHSPVHRLYVWAFGGLHRKIERMVEEVKSPDEFVEAELENIASGEHGYTSFEEAIARLAMKYKNELSDSRKLFCKSCHKKVDHLDMSNLCSDCGNPLDQRATIK